MMTEIPKENMPLAQKNRTFDQLGLEDSAILSITETKGKHNLCQERELRVTG